MRQHKVSAVLVAMGLSFGAGIGVVNASGVFTWEDRADFYDIKLDGQRMERFADIAEAQAFAEELKIENPDGRVVMVHIDRDLLRMETTIPTTTVPPTTVPPTTVPPTTVPPSGDLVWGFDATPPSETWTKPALGVTYQDPIYGVDLRRMTSADGTRFNRNTYSRRQAENVNGAIFMTYHGDAQYRFYSVADGSLIYAADMHPDAEPQWHPTDPNLVRYIGGPNSYVGSLKLFEVDITTGVETVIADFTDQVQAIWPSALYVADWAEGSPSMDGNVYAWVVNNELEQEVGIVTYDISSGQVLGSMNGILSGYGELDAISASPTGDYVIAQYWDATFSYKIDMSEQTLIVDEATHSDIALGTNGHDYYVYQDFTNGPNGGWLMSRDLVSNEEARLFDLYNDANTSIHISGKAYNKPGWVVASTYSCKVPGAWSCGKVMAVNFETGAVANLAHTYNCGDDYWTETQAVANRDLSRVYFNSDGGSCGIDAEVYVIDVPNLG